MRTGRSRQGRRRLLVPAVFGGVVLASILLLSVTGWLVWQSGHRAIHTAVTVNESLVSLLDRHAAQMIDSVKIVLKSASHELGPDLEDGARRSTLDAWLAETTRDLPHLTSVGVYDVTTRRLIYQFTRSRDPALAVVKALTDSAPQLAGPDLRFANAVFDDASGHWLLPVGMNIPLRHGAGGGVVVALISLDHLQKLYAAIDTGAEGTVVLLGPDGSRRQEHWRWSAVQYLSADQP